MTIKLKLILIAGSIAVAMLLSIGSMRWSVSTLNSLTEAQGLNHQLLADMLMLRRNEKDFLMRNDAKYLDEYNKNFALMTTHINRLGELVDKHDIEVNNYGGLLSIMKQYQSQFHKIVDTTKQIGLTHNTRLRSTLRDSVHKAEAIFKEVSNHKLLKDMLMLRRNEKDFIMRKDKKYVTKFNNNYLIFIDDIKSSNLSDTQKSTLLKDVDVYKTDFLTLAELTEKKGFTSKLGLEGDMRKAVHQSEEKLDEIREAIETYMDAP